jgi:methionyl-tRNA formyltransferase
MKIYRARPSEGTGEPGTIASVEPEGFTIATRDGVLHVLDVGPEGKRRMTAEEFARGARPLPGERME